MNYKDMNIIKIITLFVNNLAQFIAYLAIVFITLFVNNVACFTAYLDNTIQFLLNLLI